MKRRSILPILLAALAPCAGLSAPDARDLGQGLAYFRIHSISTDLPTGESARGRACIVDVRYVRGDRVASTALLSWLKAHAGPKSPVFLLANPGTAQVLLVPLNSAGAVPDLVVLGPAARDFEPDISVHVTPSAERRAYDALEKGASIDSLVTEQVEKPRNDEERLDREHLSDSAAPDQAADTGQAAPPQAAPALIDPVLQRAVQLHRALLALKRL
jgi:hypothetical protein